VTLTVIADRYKAPSNTDEIDDNSYSGGGGWFVDNDDFADALDLGSDPDGSTWDITIDDYTTEGSEPMPGAGDVFKSCWFKWVAPSTGTFTFTTMESTSTNADDVGTFGEMDTVLAIYTGASLGALSEVDSNDDGSFGLTSEIALSATSGTTYWIQAGPLNSDDTGDIVLSWE
jgi:hypothetical protein